MQNIIGTIWYSMKGYVFENNSLYKGLVNPNMPRTFGDGIIHQSHFDAMVSTDAPMPTREPATPSQVEKKIGEIIAANLVLDGATLQMGMS